MGADSHEDGPAPRRTAARGAPPARLRRVLYVAALDPSRKFGSIEEQIAILVRAFREQGSLFLPLFVTSNGHGPPAPIDESGIAVVHLDLSHFRLSTLRELVRLVRRHRIDIIHWNFTAPLRNGYLWALALLLRRVTHYFTDHNSRALPIPHRPKPVKGLAQRLLLRRYRKVLCVSRFVLDCLRQEGTWSNLDCCPHFVNTDRFKPDRATRTAVRRSLGAEDRFVVLTIAFLIKAKGVDVALRALAELPESVVLWVVGDGPEAAALRDLSAALGIGHRVRFLGLQPRVEPYMQAADCLVCPSLWAEAAGLVNIEAAACGLPVVASRIGGIPEHVEDGTTGLLFPPGDHRELAHHIRRLQTAVDLRGAMARAGRAASVARFSVPARLDAYLDLYRYPD